MAAPMVGGAVSVGGRGAGRTDGMRGKAATPGDGAVLATAATGDAETPLVGSARARARSLAAAVPGVRMRLGALAPARGRGTLAAPAAVLGGVLMAGGAFLPWLSFYAGLYPMRGVIGLWGRLLAIGGVLCALGGALAWSRTRRGRGRLVRVLSRARAVLAVALTLFATWLGVQLLLTFRGLQANPMLVPRLGPGLLVSLLGGVVMVMGELAGRGRTAASAPERAPRASARE